MTISVLITYYNEKTLLADCLESLFQGNLYPEEVIVFDDYSTDPAELYIPESLKSFVKVLRGDKNYGPGYGRNQLLLTAKSEYVHFHDSDDLFEENWYQKVRQKIIDYNADVILTGVKSTFYNNVISDDVMSIQNKKEPIDLVSWGLAGSILVPSTTFRRSIGLKVGGYETRDVLAQSEDFHFHIKLGLQNPSIKLIKESLIIQRLRLDSHSQNSVMLVCYNSALKALSMLEPSLLPHYQQGLSEAYARIGYNIFQFKDYTSARLAFNAAKKLNAQYKGRSKVFRFIAKKLGQEIAEKISRYYIEGSKILSRTRI